MTNVVTEEGLLMHTGIYTRNQTRKVGSHGLGIPLESEWMPRVFVFQYRVSHGISSLLSCF